MISIAQIEYINALIETRNFQRAAELCFVTQPTLSMQIKKAENVLGGQLFNRDTNPISLTSFGKRILPYLEEISMDYQQLNNEIKRLQGTYKAEIRIGIIPTVAGYLVPELYQDWQEQLGSIQLDIVELKTTDLIEAIQQKKIDFGIMAGPLNDHQINAQQLFNEEILVYCPEIKSKTVQTKDLDGLKPWLLSEGNCLRTQMVSFCNVNTLQKNEWHYQGGSLDILIRMVNIEGGYTLIPSNFKNMLSIDPADLKAMKDPTPIRQIIGINLSRNTKFEHIKLLIRLIQRKKSNNKLHLGQTEILPWS